SRRRHTRSYGDWSSDVCSSDLGCAFDENGVALSGMGVAVADYDGDGWLDIARTNFSEQVTSLYRNYGNGAFEDASARAGLGINRSEERRVGKECRWGER